MDIVFGIRKGRKNMPAVLKFGNEFINKVMYLFYSIKVPDTQCGFRVFKAEIYQKIVWKNSGYGMESEMIENVGRNKLRYSFIEVSTIYSDKYKGTTVTDGVKIVLDMFWRRLSRW